jgi:hypothetical protein
MHHQQTDQKKFVFHLDLLGVLLTATAASHARLGHVALEDTVLDVLRVVFLTLLGVCAAEVYALHVLVGLGAQEEHEGGDEDDGPFPEDCVSICSKVAKSEM